MKTLVSSISDAYKNVKGAAKRVAQIGALATAGFVLTGTGAPVNTAEAQYISGAGTRIEQRVGRADRNTNVSANSTVGQRTAFITQLIEHSDKYITGLAQAAIEEDGLQAEARYGNPDPENDPYDDKWTHGGLFIYQEPGCGGLTGVVYSEPGSLDRDNNLVRPRPLSFTAERYCDSEAQKPCSDLSLHVVNDGRETDFVPAWHPDQLRLRWGTSDDVNNILTSDVDASKYAFIPGAAEGICCDNYVPLPLRTGQELFKLRGTLFVEGLEGARVLVTGGFPESALHAVARDPIWAIRAYDKGGTLRLTAIYDPRTEQPGSGVLQVVPELSDMDGPGVKIFLGGVQRPQTAAQYGVPAYSLVRIHGVNNSGDIGTLVSTTYEPRLDEIVAGKDPQVAPFVGVKREKPFY